MGFDPSVITEVFPPGREGSRLTLEWTSSAAAGTWYQIYLQGSLAWYGTETHATIDTPRGLIDGAIGAVADGEQTTDFSNAGLEGLPFDVGGMDIGGLGITPITTRAYLAWYGFGASHYGIFEGAAGFDQGGFDQGSFNGTHLGEVTATEQGLSTDGFDLGAFDTGGLDLQGGDFSWESDPLARGTWHFAVVPYDEANNPGTPSITAVTITAPPRPPASSTAGKRLSYTYNSGAHTITLVWLASPG